jgi:hypothetical protein
MQRRRTSNRSNKRACAISSHVLPLLFVILVMLLPPRPAAAATAGPGSGFTGAAAPGSDLTPPPGQPREQIFPAPPLGATHSQPEMQPMRGGGGAVQAGTGGGVGSAAAHGTGARPHTPSLLQLHHLSARDHAGSSRAPPALDTCPNYQKRKVASRWGHLRCPFHPGAACSPPARVRIWVHLAPQHLLAQYTHACFEIFQPS